MYNTSFIGSQIIKVDSVDSTNSYMTSLLKEAKVFEGTILVANEQTGGKGQMGNKWLSERDKNLTISLVIYPKNLTPLNHYILSEVTALAISDLLDLFDIPNTIKWPNDIITPKGKICGILIENGVSGNHISHSIIGVGLNVNQNSFNASLKATAMINFLNEETTIQSVLTTFCNMFDKWYIMLTANKLENIHKAYLQKLLHFNKNARFIFKGELVDAKIIDVEKNGLLKLEKVDGNSFLADLKEISLAS